MKKVKIVRFAVKRVDYFIAYQQKVVLLWYQQQKQ